MVPDRYPIVAGALAGLVTLRHLVVPSLHAWVDAEATVIAGYYAATMWLAFLLVPVGAVVVGYAGGRAADDDPGFGRAGAVCFAVGLLASLVAVAVALAIRPATVAYGGFLQTVTAFAFPALQSPVVAALALVAGAALARG